MSIIILTPPPTKPGGGNLVANIAGTPTAAQYAEARELLDAAEAEGLRVRIVQDE